MTYYSPAPRMNLDGLTIEELRRQRRQTTFNLKRLDNASSAWDAATAARGEATRANLLRKITDIDARLELLTEQRKSA